MRPRTLPGEPKHQLFVPVSHEEVLRNLPRYDVQRQPQVHPHHLKDSAPTPHAAVVPQTYDIDRQQGSLMPMPEDGARSSRTSKGGASLSRRGLADAIRAPAKVEESLEVLDAAVHRPPGSATSSHDAAQERASTSAPSRARRPDETTPFVKHDTNRPLLYKHALDQAVDYACKTGKCPGVHHFGSLDAFATSKQYHWGDEKTGMKKSGFFRVKAIGTKGQRLMPGEKDADPVHKHNFRLQLAPGQKFQHGNEKFEGAPEDHEMRHRLPSNDWSELHLVGKRPDRSIRKQPRRIETETAQAFSEQELLRKISKHMHTWNREGRDRDAIELTPGIEGTLKGPARFYEYQNHKLRKGKPMPTILLTPHDTTLSAEDVAAAMRARAAKKARKDAAQRAEQQSTSITTHESLDTAGKPLDQRLLRAANAPAYHPLRASYGSVLEHAAQGFRRLSLQAPREPHSPKFNPVPYSSIANAPPNAKTNKPVESASPATLVKRVFRGGVGTSSECLQERTLEPTRKLVFAKRGSIAPSHNLMRTIALPPRTPWKRRLQRRGTPMTTIEWSKWTKYEPLTQSTIQKSVNYCQKHVCRDLKRFKPEGPIQKVAEPYAVHDGNTVIDTGVVHGYGFDAHNRPLPTGRLRRDGTTEYRMAILMSPTTLHQDDFGNTLMGLAAGADARQKRSRSALELTHGFDSKIRGPADYTDHQSPIVYHSRKRTFFDLTPHNGQSIEGASGPAPHPLKTGQWVARYGDTPHAKDTEGTLRKFDRIAHQQRSSQARPEQHLTSEGSSVLHPAPRDSAADRVKQPHHRALPPTDPEFAQLKSPETGAHAAGQGTLATDHAGTPLPLKKLNPSAKPWSPASSGSLHLDHVAASFRSLRLDEHGKPGRGMHTENGILGPHPELPEDPFGMHSSVASSSSSHESKVHPKSSLEASPHSFDTVPRKSWLAPRGVHLTFADGVLPHWSQALERQNAYKAIQRSADAYQKERNPDIAGMHVTKPLRVLRRPFYNHEVAFKGRPRIFSDGQGSGGQSERHRSLYVPLAAGQSWTHSRTNTVYHGQTHLDPPRDTHSSTEGLMASRSTEQIGQLKPQHQRAESVGSNSPDDGGEHHRAWRKRTIEENLPHILLTTESKRTNLGKKHAQRPLIQETLGRMAHEHRLNGGPLRNMRQFEVTQKLAPTQFEHGQRVAFFGIPKDGAGRELKLPEDLPQAYEIVPPGVKPDKKLQRIGMPVELREGLMLVDHRSGQLWEGGRAPRVLAPASVPTTSASEPHASHYKSPNGKPDVSLELPQTSQYAAQVIEKQRSLLQGAANHARDLQCPDMAVAKLRGGFYTCGPVSQKRLETAADAVSERGTNLGRVKLTLAPGDKYREPHTGKVFYGPSKDVGSLKASSAPVSHPRKLDVMQFTTNHDEARSSSRAHSTTASALRTQPTLGSKMNLVGSESARRPSGTKEMRFRDQAKVTSRPLAFRPREPYTRHRSSHAARPTASAQRAETLRSAHVDDRDNRAQAPSNAKPSGGSEQYKPSFPRGITGTSALNFKHSSTSDFPRDRKRMRQWSPDSDDEDRRRPTHATARIQSGLQ
ncbi:hypothetical protein CBOM_06332 [Ceraceosorus bombacis]|uniref:Uncharacterized protein n=1 Tax=Ceraceosorus bombacis TaxID=401625 RepID=A0A0P1BQK5_9BASI|nr:hypothetical protein CBOM_06332 [Ceraceosorus bombacis]